jgi:hypothetical protein
VPGRVGAALTKPGWASTARWCAPGERDGEEYERNPRDYVPQDVTDPEPGGYGSDAVRTSGSARGNSWMGLCSLIGRPR